MGREEGNGNSAWHHSLASLLAGSVFAGLCQGEDGNAWHYNTLLLLSIYRASASSVSYM